MPATPSPSPWLDLLTRGVGGTPVRSTGLLDADALGAAVRRLAELGAAVHLDPDPDPVRSFPAAASPAEARR